MVKSLSPSYTGSNITRLLWLALLLTLDTRNNTDRNKLVIFFGIVCTMVNANILITSGAVSNIIHVCNL